MIEWVGAVTGVLALTWNIYRLKHEGAVVRLSVSRSPSIRGGENASVTVVNVGQQPTTFTHLLLMRHKSAIHRLFFRMPESVQAIDPESNESLPINLRPGDIWHGTIKEATIRRELDCEGVKYIFVYHAFSRSPAIARLR